MYKKICLLILIATFFTGILQAQSKKEKQVATAVETLRKGMIDGDLANLESITASSLSYGHSSGHIDDKKEFVEKLAIGSSDFVTITLTEQTITVTGKTAFVRHTLDATSNDGGKPGIVNLKVLLVWQKLNGSWKLMARQAVKLT
jgi:ketosteroid isomerase-like protein